MQAGTQYFLMALLLCLTATTSTAGNSILGPPTNDGPIVVDVGFFLSNINEISEEDETFDFEGLLSMHWKDPRLAFDPAETGCDHLYYQGSFQVTEVYGGWWPQIFLAYEAGRFERQSETLMITPEGDVSYTSEIDAIAKSSLQLRRFPFDNQQFVALFEVLGLDKSQVVLRADSADAGIWNSAHHQVQVPQWREPRLSTSIVEYDPRFDDGHDTPLTAFRVQVEIERDPWYMLRLVVLPVIVFVILSWSVFWMDRSSLGDRMDISFIGILTVVAYQIMFSENLPKISYLTVLMSFMHISFLTMCASVVVNLRVAAHDKNGRPLLGDRMDARCRYIFPIAYLLATVLVGGILYRMG